jgi:hypothetical protein
MPTGPYTEKGNYLTVALAPSGQGAPANASGPIALETQSLVKLCPS